ncbi:MAG: hypothetical protein V5A24_03230 [Haloarculaceae archaeon]
MPADVTVLRAARNAFLFVLLALVAVSTYQFATTGGIEPGIAVIWIVGAGGFYASKWYYGRSSDGAADAVADDDGRTSVGKSAEIVADADAETTVEDSAEIPADADARTTAEESAEIVADDGSETGERPGEGN